MMDRVVPVNSLARHIAPISDELSAIATEVVASGYYVLGPGVEAFEAEFASYCGVSNCIGVANGTDALELALRGLGIGRGDRIAVAANAAMYGTTAILACGADPVFIDVEPLLGGLDVFALEAALNDGEVKAVIVTHLYGRLAAIEAVLELCRDRGIRVIEDCAQAHGAERGGRKSGSFGDVGCFSFYPTKNLGALGDGGAIVTADAALATRIRRLRQYGWAEKYNVTLPGGRNSRLDEIQARFLSRLLKELDRWNERRRAIANRYSLEINNARIAVPEPSDSEFVAHLFVVQSESRDELRDHLASCGVATDVHYPTPDHRQFFFGDRFMDLNLPVTERQSRVNVTLPCFPELTEVEVQRVIDACNQF